MATKRSIKKRIEEQEAEQPGGGGGLEVVFREYRAEDFDDPLDPNYEDIEPVSVQRSGYDENGEWHSERTEPDRGGESDELVFNETVFGTPWSPDDGRQGER